MSPAQRERVLTLLENMNDQQLDRLLEVIEDMSSSTDEYPDDPLVGFFSGAEDLGERTKEILERGFGQREDDTQV